MKCNRLLVLVGFFLVMLIVIACSETEQTGGDLNQNNSEKSGNVQENNGQGNNNDGNNDGSGQEEPEEITLNFWNQSIGTDNYEELKTERLGELFPHITFEWHRIHVQAGQTETIQEQFAGGNVPDVMFIQDSGFQLLNDMEMLYDLTDLIEQYNVDMNRWPDYLQQALYANQPNDGSIYALPRRTMYHGLAYNKDIFDMFGVPYPEDDMTWDEIVSLASDVTGEHDGVQYRGLDIPHSGQMFGMLDDWLVNESNEVQIDGRDDVRNLIQMLENVGSIPGNVPNDTEDFLIRGAMILRMSKTWP